MIPRNWAIEFINTWWFDPLILMVILLNVSVMAWESPMDPPGTWKADFIDQLEVFFLYAYTVEMLLKMLAYGILGNKNCYLHDGWCQLDFVVVSCAWAPILLTGIDLPNVNSLRALRAFRALRAMKIIPGLKVIVEGIMDVIPKLGNVTMLFIFVFVVFGIVGMELFQGMLHYRCVRLLIAPDS
jgi:voltage-dependent calcium channel T type alpha-1I